MTHEDFLLNKTWNRFFNLAVILPIVVALTGVFFLMLAFVGFFSLSYAANQSIDLALFSGSALLIVLVCTFLILWFAYLIWFVIESDSLFKLLGMNRIVGNSLNIVGLIVFSGLSFLVLPILFYIKVRDYWHDRGMHPNWKGVILDR
jgi:hypothetical protein